MHKFDNNEDADNMASINLFKQGKYKVIIVSGLALSEVERGDYSWRVVIYDMPMWKNHAYYYDMSRGMHTSIIFYNEEKDKETMESLKFSLKYDIRE